MWRCTSPHKKSQSEKVWIRELNLYERDREILPSPIALLTNNIIDAAQTLLRQAFQVFSGLQSVTLDWWWTWHWASRVCPDHRQWKLVKNFNNRYFPCVWKHVSHTRESTDSCTLVSSNLFKIHECSDAGRGLWMWPLCSGICSCPGIWKSLLTEDAAQPVEMLREQENQHVPLQQVTMSHRTDRKISWRAASLLYLQNAGTA